jgi:glycosyltransferase involved in cell wall biosynthesis
MSRPDPQPGLPPAGVVAERRVLLIAPQPFFRVTGTPINVLMMCRALTEGGYRVDLLTLPYGEDVGLPGLTLHRVRRLPGLADVPVGFSAAKPFYNLVLAAAVLRLLRRHRFVVVHAIEEAAFYAVPLARWFGVPGVVDLDSDLARQLREHGSLTARLLARPAAWLRRAALRRAAAALAVARQMSAIARAESPHTPVFEIPDIPIEDAGRAPHPGRMAAQRAALGLEGKRLLVYTGNYDRRQGLLELVRALPPVLQRHPDAVLLVVGGDAAKVRALQGEVDRQGLGAAVRLIGPRPPETMAEYMGMAEVLVSPRLEPYATPLKIFSYMASGRPIVATDLPTHTAILDCESAILVPPTSEGLAAGLIAALDDPAAATGRGTRARHLVEERYTFALFKQQLLTAYAAVIDGSDLGTVVTPTQPATKGNPTR